MARSDDSGDAKRPTLSGRRIGLDARTGSQRSTGVSTYAAVLAHSLRHAGAVLEEVSDGEAGSSEFAAAFRCWASAALRRPRQLEPDDGSGVRVWRREDVFREAQAHFSLHGRLLPLRCADPPEIMHWTYPLPLVLEGAINVYTIHDAIPLDNPRLTDISRGRHRRLLERISRVAEPVITVSEHSRVSLTPWLPHLSRPIVNTYQAVLTPPPSSHRLPNGLEPGRYLLACGRVEPRKNLGRLVAAHQQSGVRFPLVIVGPDGWRANRELSRERLGPKVIRLPWVERPLLFELIRHARALAFPSLTEGFGLPALEAMALGVPVLASDRGGLAEVASGAALVIDPLDVSALAEALLDLSTDDGLCERLSSAGRLRASGFSTETYVARLVKAYDALS